MKLMYTERIINNEEQSWENTCKIMNQIAEEQLGPNLRANRKPWITDGTWQLIEQRNKLKIQMANNPQIKQQYADVAKKVKRAARSDKRSYIESLADEAEKAAGSNNIRKLHQIINRLTNKKPKLNQPVRDRNGILLTTTEEQTKRWMEHFRDLSNSSETELGLPCSAQEQEGSIACDPPNITETATAIGKLKRNKACGADGIPPELFLIDTQIAANIIQPHIAQAWRTETINCSWTRGNIVKLPKKDDLRDCDNWRGITLLNTIYKVLATIILKRLETVEAGLRDEQAGFRPHRSCVDQVNTLRIIIEQSIEWKSPLYLVFVDFKKAFDAVNRNAIWLALNRKGVPNKIIQVIKAMYTNAELQVLHNGTISDTFTTNMGVRQGCPLSPLLFAVVMDCFMEELCKKKRGIAWSFQRHLEDLEYADDICLLSHKLSDMQDKTNDLVKLARRVGLEINIKKTYAMRLHHSSNAHITIDNHRIEYVDCFCYLGSKMSSSGGINEDITNRLNKARSAFGRLKYIWRAPQITRTTKIRIFNACVKSTLLYGSETWLASESIRQRLQVFINKSLRIICGIYWPNTITNENLWSLAKEEPIHIQIKRRKWKWIGHTLRKPVHNVTRMALEWNPHGSRQRGRPKNTWRRSVRKELADINKSWDEAKIIANNRLSWKYLVEALCSLEE